MILLGSDRGLQDPLWRPELCASIYISFPSTCRYELQPRSDIMLCLHSGAIILSSSITLCLSFHRKKTQNTAKEDISQCERAVDDQMYDMGFT